MFCLGFSICGPGPLRAPVHTFKIRRGWRELFCHALMARFVPSNCAHLGDRESIRRPPIRANFERCRRIGYPPARASYSVGSTYFVDGEC